MVLYCGKLSSRNSALGSVILDRITCGEIRRFPREFNALCKILMRKRAAARKARSAVTGPCTEEYEPLMDGKKKINRTHRAATKASSHVMRPGIIDVS